MSILLLTVGFTINTEVFASPPIKEKEKTGWGQIKKMKLVDLEGTLDMNFDGTADAYLKLTNPGKHNKASQIEIKITGECIIAGAYKSECPNNTIYDAAKNRKFADEASFSGKIVLQNLGKKYFLYNE